MYDGPVALFVAAEAREFDGFMEIAEKSERLSWPVQFARRVEYGGSVAVLAAHGPGAQLASQAVAVAAERERLASVISTGFCGGLDPRLVPSDIFVARELIGHTKDSCNRLGPVATLPLQAGRASTGALISSDRVAVTAAQKAELRCVGGDAVEMEAAGVAQAAVRLSLPFYCIRVVTDTAGESLPLDFNRMRDGEGRFSRLQIVLAGCRNPGVVFPKLIQFNQRCKHASKALGDFLANCRF